MISARDVFFRSSRTSVSEAWNIPASARVDQIRSRSLATGAGPGHPRRTPPALCGSFTMTLLYGIFSSSLSCCEYNVIRPAFSRLEKTYNYQLQHGPHRP